MSETFIIDWPALALIGLIFGSFAPRDRWWASRAFGAALVTASTFTLVAMASYLVAPDWMWMYFLDPESVTWAVWLMPGAYLFAFGISFAAGVSLAAAGRVALFGAIAITAGLQIAVIGLTWDRYHLVGTAAEWASGRAHELFSAAPSGEARTIGLIVPLFAVVAVVAFVWTIRGRRAAPSDR